LHLISPYRSLSFLPIATHGRVSPRYSICTVDPQVWRCLSDPVGINRVLLRGRERMIECVDCRIIDPFFTTFGGDWVVKTIVGRACRERMSRDCIHLSQLHVRTFNHLSKQGWEVGMHSMKKVQCRSSSRVLYSIPLIPALPFLPRQ